MITRRTTHAQGQQTVENVANSNGASDTSVDVDELLEELQVDLGKASSYRNPKEKVENLEVMKARQILVSTSAAEFLPLKDKKYEFLWVKNRREKYVVEVGSFLKRAPQDFDDIARSLSVKVILNSHLGPRSMQGNHGVFAEKLIPEGTVIEYLGVVRLSDEHDAIVRKDPFCPDQFYVWDTEPVDLHPGKASLKERKRIRFCISGYGVGNCTALVNDPSGFQVEVNGKRVPAESNMVPATIFWKGIPRLLYITTKDIKPGEQLFLDYMDKAEKAVLDSTNEIARWSFYSLVYRHKVDKKFPLPKIVTQLSDFLGEEEMEIEEDTGGSDRRWRSVKLAVKDVSTPEMEFVESWLPAGYKIKFDHMLPGELEEEIARLEKEEEEKKLKRKLARSMKNVDLVDEEVLYDGEAEDENPRKKRRKDPKRDPILIEDSEEVSGPPEPEAPPPPPIVIPRIPVKIRTDEDLFTHWRYDLEPEPESASVEIIEPKKEENIKEERNLKRERNVKRDGSMKAEVKKEAEPRRPQYHEILDLKRKVADRWVRPDERWDYEVPQDVDDPEDEDVDYLEIFKDSELESEESLDPNDVDPYDARICEADYDSDYDGPPEDGKIYRLINPKPHQLLLFRSTADGLWYSSMIGSVFLDENDELCVKLRFEGFSHTHDETIRADLLGRFRPHEGLESSSLTKRHRMYKSIYRFGFSRENNYAELEDVTKDKMFQAPEPTRNTNDDFDEKGAGNDYD